MNTMKICFFGSYERSKYNMLLKKILEQQNIQVIECHAEITGFSSFILGYLKLWRKHRKIEVFSNSLFISRVPYDL